MNGHGKTEVGRKAVADILPAFAGIIRTIEAPVVLQKKTLRSRGMHDDFVNALAEVGLLVGHEHGANAAVLCGPGATAIRSAVEAAG